jgi:hypothetical protein
MGVGGKRHAPADLPPGKTQNPLSRRLGGPHGRSGQVRKISPPPEFDPRTVQPVGSRYTDYATLPALRIIYPDNFIEILTVPVCKFDVHIVRFSTGYTSRGQHLWFNNNFSNTKRMSFQHFNKSILIFEVFIHNFDTITGQCITNTMILYSFT